MDESLLLWVNQTWAHPALDIFFGTLSSRLAFALPLALVLLAIFTWRWRKAGFQLWLAMMLVVGAGDAIGNVLKHVFAQPRPCYALAEQVRQINAPPGTPCGDSLSGMPSNHAVNAFATAAFLTAVLGRRAAVLWLIAALVALSRVYLGKHYPSQIAAGAILGTVWGLAGAWLGLKYTVFMQGLRHHSGRHRKSDDERL